MENKDKNLLITILTFGFVLCLALLCFADNIKVVKNKQTGEIVYRQEPSFEQGKGIENAVKLKGGSPANYEEVYITQAEWNEEKVKPGQDKENLKKQKIEELRVKLGLTIKEFQDLVDVIKN